MGSEFERLRNLVNEITTLCENTEKEIDEIKDKIDENKEHTYFMFCTELAPYWELVKRCGRRIYVDTNVLNSEGKYFSILFTSDYVAMTSMGVNIAYITRNDFISFGTLRRNNSYGADRVYKVAKNIDWNDFEKNFATSIEIALTERAKIANDNKAYAEKKLADTK